MSVEAKAFFVLLALLGVLAVVVLVMGVGGDGAGYDEAALHGKAAWLREWAEGVGRAGLDLDDVAERSGCTAGGGGGGDVLTLPQGQPCRLRFAPSDRPVRRGEVHLDRGLALRLQLDQERYVPVDLTLGRGASRPVDVTRGGASMVLTCLQGEARGDQPPVCRVRLRPARS